MSKHSLKNRVITAALAATVLAGATGLQSSIAIAAPASTVRPTSETAIALGTGRLIKLPGAMTDLFVADPAIADVQVRSPSQLYIFGKANGQTSLYATNKDGRVIYSTSIRVGNNIDSIDAFLHAAMPEAKIKATTMNGVVLLTGTVKSPEDIEQASSIVDAYVGGAKIISRLKTATPLQVMLRVRIAEVSRSVSKDVGLNLLTRDQSGGFLFGAFHGTGNTIKDVVKPVFDKNGLEVINPLTGGQLQQQVTEYTWVTDAARYTLGAGGKILGMDVLAALDLAEQNGRVATLAEPTLTALSGETASFLAGGEFPIPMSQGLGATSIEYKSYGVSLSFTPIVLDDGRISMRVRPEVSQISDQGAVRLNGFTVPATTTRRAETTVELGSGQSFMIGGLLSNSSNNSVQKAPWLGDLPILGNLFRSNGFRRNETELVIVVTPYLVKPVSDSEIALPTDGFRTANDAERVILDRTNSSKSGERRPGPTLAPPATVGAGGSGEPIVGVVAPSANTAAVKPKSAAASSGATPGFSL